MTLNNIIIIVMLLIIAVIVAYYCIASTSIPIDSDYQNVTDIDYLVQCVKSQFNNVQKENIRDMNLTEDEMRRKEKLRAELKKALKEAAYGSRNDKKLVKNYIKDIIQSKSVGINKEIIDDVISFCSPGTLKPLDKHEILFHVYSKKYGKDGFAKMLVETGLFDKAVKFASEDTTGHTPPKITEEMLDEAYRQVMKSIELSYDDKIEIVAQRIFEKYKGFGVFDTLRDTSLDGISGGVSGIPSTTFEIARKDLENASYSYDSVWCMFRGVTLNLAYLSCGSEAELIRICKNVYKYNNPGTMSEQDGFKVSTMKDGSRVAVARPPMSGSWCFWIRKFDSVDNIAPEKLLIHENKEIPITFAKWLIKGCCTTMITGQPGCGKTTFLKTLIRYIDPQYTLRISEIASELNLNFTYPERNIVSFQEKGANTQAILDFIKKTDGSVNILGEIATHEAASWFIQNGQVASLFSLATHHAKTVRALISAMRNSLLETSGFNNEKIAEEQVVETLRINIHLQNTKGQRYIDRITEIVPVRDRRYPSELKDIDLDTATKEDLIEYFKRVTDRQTYEENVLCRFDKKEGRYVFVNPPTPELIEEMKRHLSDIEEAQFESEMAEIEKMTAGKGDEAC